MTATRRDVLKAGGLGALAATGITTMPWWFSVEARTGSRLARRHMPEPFQVRFVPSPVLGVRTVREADGELTDLYRVVERPARARILPGGLTTPVWTYNGTTPGPTIKVRRTRRVKLEVANGLPRTHPELGHRSDTSVHLHGSASLPQFDGYANDLIPPGCTKTYLYPNIQGARTLWYHDHAVHHTAQNAYSGLAAQYHMHEPSEEDALPQLEFDVALTIRDALFEADGRLMFDDRSQTQLDGDVILVNGRPWPVMEVKRRIYRFRFLNASVSRSYRFALSTDDPVTVVATDGGLMPRARQVTEWRHGPAERYEVLVDFRSYRPGQRVVLRNLSNPNKVEFRHTDVVMAFDVTDEAFDTDDVTWSRIPDMLETADVMRLTDGVESRKRTMRFERKGGGWTINGRTWEDVVDSRFQEVIADPGLGDIELWTLENRSGGWFHPVHIHLVDFRILDRNGRPPFDYELGPKDTVYVGENEKVRLIMRFGPHTGRYMMHCHNLVHEDHDMMHQFAVGWKRGRPDPNNPLSVRAC